MKIEKYSFDKDIHVLCVQAASFPNGVMAAFEQLHARLPDSMSRKSYGISRPEGGGGIVYKAATEEKYEGEAAETGLERFTIRKGEYIGCLITDFKKDVQSIGRTFRELLAQPGIDPDGYCLEWYPNASDVQCMVPIA